ncbi:hypothetical protein KEM52_000601, partial [Ascosphaera acerosa]
GPSPKGSLLASPQASSDGSASEKEAHDASTWGVETFRPHAWDDQPDATAKAADIDQHKAASRNHSKEPQTLSTARLREQLLPQRKRQRALRRRQRLAAAGTPELHPSSEAESGPVVVNSDDDELSYVAVTTGRPKAKARRGVGARRLAATTGPGKENKGGRAATASTAADRGRRRTYGKRRAAGDDDVQGQDEHDDRSEDGSAPPPQTEVNDARKVEDELMKQKRKFEEISKWDLEFEDVPDKGEPSSPYR